MQHLLTLEGVDRVSINDQNRSRLKLPAEEVFSKRRLAMLRGARGAD